MLTAAESRIYDLKNPIGDFTPKDNYTEFRVQYMDDPGLALKFSAKYALISLPKPDRTVRLATGDQLIYELWMDTKTPGGLIDIMTTDGQRAYTNGYWTANDGGYLLDADFTGRAYMRWHERIVTLQEGIDGKELDSLWLATQTKVEEDGLYMAARYRNIRIVDKNGKLKYAFDSSQYYFDNEGKNGAFIQRNEDGSQPSVASFVVSNWHADDTRVPNPDGETPPLPLLSPVAEIGNLTINGTSASVNGNTLIIRLPKGTVVTALSPVFQLSKGATIDKTGAQNFTNPVKYTVTSEDGKTRKPTPSRCFWWRTAAVWKGNRTSSSGRSSRAIPTCRWDIPRSTASLLWSPPARKSSLRKAIC